MLRNSVFFSVRRSLQQLAFSTIRGDEAREAVMRKRLSPLKCCQMSQSLTEAGMKESMTLMTPRDTATIACVAIAMSNELNIGHCAHRSSDLLSRDQLGIVSSHRRVQW